MPPSSRRLIGWIAGIVWGGLGACYGPPASDDLPRLVSASPLPASGRIVDLTHPLAESDSIDSDASPTRLRAPASRGGELSVDRIDPGALIGPAVVIDIEDRARDDPDTTLARDDWLAYESRHGPIPAGAIILIRAGWDGRHGDSARYWNADAHGGFHFPGIGEEAVRFLLEQRDIRGIGVDGPRLDPGWLDARAAEAELLAAGRYVVENLRGIDRLPPAGATVIVAPALAVGAGVALARVLGVVPRAGS